ncbi:MAG: hypothetical protein ACOCRX_05335 [Candidatus Woesearchaeota archaeon]
MKRIFEQLEEMNLTNEEKDLIKKELEEMTVSKGEDLIIESTGSSTDQGEVIYQVRLGNRHVCYI